MSVSSILEVKMASVNTVAGPVDVEALGMTYMHEHIFIVSPEMQHYWPGYGDWDEGALVEKARVALRRLHDEFGVRTILDPTVAGLGRNVRAVAPAAEGTNLNIIVGTGWYSYATLPFTFCGKDVEAKADELARLFMIDIARRVIAVADSTKNGRQGFTSIVPTEAIDALITDEGADRDEISALRDRGVDVVVT